MSVDHFSFNFTVLSKNCPLTVQGEEVKAASFWQRVGRFFSKSYANAEDGKVAEVALRYFAQLEESEKQQALKHLEIFSRYKERNIVPIRQMQNIVAASKVAQALLHFSKEKLLTEDLEETDLLRIIRQNFLHKVLPEVDLQHAHSAIIEGEENQLFIRAPGKESFLETPEKIQRLINSFASLPSLTEEQELELSLLEKLLGDPNDQRVRQHLKGNYSYCPLNEVVRPQDFRITGAYYVDGVQEHDSWNFEELKPTMVRFSSPPSEGFPSRYELRIVTRKPDYSREGSSLWEFISSIPSISKHGHSYLELVEHEEIEGYYTGKETVYNVGYFLRGRLESHDRTSFVPLGRGGRARERFFVNEEQFFKGKRIIEGVQAMMLQPGCTANTGFSARDSIREEDEAIRRVYQTVIKGSCLTFANLVVEEAAQIDLDRRSPLRKWICPRSFYGHLDCVDKILSYVPIVNFIVHGLALVNRAEIPAYSVTSSGDSLYDVQPKIDSCKYKFV